MAVRISTGVTLDELLTEVVERDGSDLHVKAHEPPIFRIYGKLVRTQHPTFSPKDARDLIYSILSPEQQRQFERELELDLAYMLPGVARFRVNVFQQKHCVGACMRAIPMHVRTIDDLGLPQVLKHICEQPRGLVLVTGPTGCGKSTTLAAMVDHINNLYSKHIVTIEHPIEFLHEDRVGKVNQREVAIDTHSYADALRHVMRQNPDVILVGEMRDLETIALAITAAETGHLVFSTLHTTDVEQTVDRVIDVFEPDRQQQIRLQLSVTLAAILCQSLLPRAREAGRIAAFEIMIITPAIRSLIREGKTHQLYAQVQTGGELGMTTLDESLLQLYRSGTIAYEEAVSMAANPREFADRAKKP